MKTKLNYESPTVRIVKAVIEKGFAASVVEDKSVRVEKFCSGGSAW